jgi:predicted 3-demethylubiquinone-9 3-methyltransferase (glyoxalase superfamily)
MSATFELEGLEFIALNAGPQFQFTPAISFFVQCETQEEVDRYWEKLSEGGAKDRCGWLRDRFGVSWQVVPKVLWKLLQETDAATSARVMRAMMQMDKLDIAGLKRAAEAAE